MPTKPMSQEPDVIDGQIVNAYGKIVNKQGKAIAGLTSRNPALNARQQRVWRLYAIEGWTQAEIGAEMGLSQRYISDIVTAVRRLMPQETRQKQIERQIDDLNELADAWRERAMVSVQAAMVYRQILRDQRELLGLNAPTRLDVAAIDPNAVHYVIEDDDIEAMR